MVWSAEPILFLIAILELQPANNFLTTTRDVVSIHRGRGTAIAPKLLNSLNGDAQE